MGGLITVQCLAITTTKGTLKGKTIVYAVHICNPAMSNS